MYGTCKNSIENGTNKRPACGRGDDNTLVCSFSLPTMSNTLPLPQTSYWTSTDRASFVDLVSKEKIFIEDTDPKTIEAIRLKYWNHKSKRSFRDNYRKVAADLLVERSVHGGRGKKMSPV